MISHRPFSLFRRSGPVALALAALLVLGLPLRAQSDNSDNSGQSQQNPPQLSDSTSEKLGQLKPLTDAKNWPAALALLNGILANVAPDSYDAASVNAYMANIYLENQQYDQAIGPLERALTVAQQKNFFDQKTRLQFMTFLGQLYYQQAATTKDKDLRASAFAQADHYLSEWLRLTPKPTSDVQLLYTNLLYQEALSVGPKPDLGLIKRAKEQAIKGLQMDIHPKEGFYALLLACDQQEGDLKDTAKVLEVLLNIDPHKKDYWSALLGTYVGLQDNVRAILTIERAQKLGYLRTPKDNYNLIGMYFNVGQFQKAVDLLEAGLDSGGIESTLDNWKLLAFSYQQLHKEFKAVSVLKHTTELFPEKAGDTYYLIAQIYYSIDKSSDALAALQECAAHGGSDKPFQTWTFMAFLALEAKKNDVAQQAITEAAKYTEGNAAHEHTVQQLSDALKAQQAILDQQSKQAARAAGSL